MRYGRKEHLMNAAIKRTLLGLISVLLCFAVRTVEVKGNELETVRVGFYRMDGYHMQDEKGNRSGYGYAMLQKIGRYLPVKYEYVGYDKSWNDMLDMLEKGEIDVLTGGKKTPEREEKFAYSEYAVGTDVTVFSVREGDNRFIPKDYSTYDGAKVGFLTNSVRKESFQSYAQNHHFSYDAVYYDTFEELEQALQDGVIDGIASSNLRKFENEWIIDQFDYVDFYLMTRKGNQVLLDQINRAIELLDRDEPGWRTTLMYEYYGESEGASASLTAEECSYLDRMREENKVFKVLVNPDRSPYSFFEQGEAKGIIPSIFQRTADELGISFMYLQARDRAQYHRILDSQEADICLDMEYNYSVAEDFGYRLTDEYLSTGFSRITRKTFSGEIQTVASIRDSFLLQDYLGERFADENIVYFDSVDECMDAVRDGKADAVFLYTYTVQEIMKKVHPETFDSVIMGGEHVSVAMGVRSDFDPCFLTALNKTVLNVADTELDNIILDATEDYYESQSLLHFLYANPVYGIILSLILGMAAVILVASISRWRKEKELRKAYEEVKAANNAKREFLSKMSHDVRTPMNAIIGMTELAELHADDEETVRNYLGRLRLSENYLLTLLSEILDMSRIDSGSMQLQKQPVSLHKIIHTVDATIRQMAEEKKQELLIRSEGVRHPAVNADERRIEQILTNLLSNACKYSGEGGKISLDITEEEDGVFCFRVKDNGIGIPREFQKSVYDAFSRAEDSRVSKIQGTGLGMTIVKKYVEMMDGTISFESEPGNTEFVVKLSLELCEEPLQEEPDEAKEEELFDGLRVLLVEDNELNREIAEELLKNVGVQVDCAENGKEGVEMFAASESGTYDVIFMDIQMPVMDGLQASRMIRQSEREDSNVMIVALSANAHEEDVENCRIAGMNGHISKPFDVARMYEVLRKVKKRQKF